MGNSPSRAAGLATIRQRHSGGPAPTTPATPAIPPTVVAAYHAYQTAAAEWQRARDAWRAERDPAQKSALARAQNAALERAQTARDTYRQALEHAATVRTRGERAPATLPSAPAPSGWTPAARATAADRFRAQWDERLGAGRATIRSLAPGERLPRVPISAFVHEELARRAHERGDTAMASGHEAEATRLRAPYEAARGRLAGDPEKLAAAERAAQRLQRFAAKQALARIRQYGEEGAVAVAQPGRRRRAFVQSTAKDLTRQPPGAA